MRREEPTDFWQECADSQAAPQILLAPRAARTVNSPRVMKPAGLVRNYFVLPCCLLLLNLCIELVSYKARMIDDAMLRTAAIIAMVLFGGSVVAFLVAPAITTIVGALHRGTRQRWGELGEVLFLVALGVLVFWLYYRVYILGPETILPAAWRNPPHYHR